MQHLDFSFRIRVISSEKELDEADRSLLSAALQSCERAYAPYSGFSVGAAALLEDGSSYTGNNQESAAYPTGLCAERVLLFRLLSEFPDRKIKTLAIRCVSKKHPVLTPQSPCGSCRQILAEAEQRQGAPIRLLLQGERGEIWEIDRSSSLLPFPFSLNK